jgi:hypothetical protein
VHKPASRPATLVAARNRTLEANDGETSQAPAIGPDIDEKGKRLLADRDKEEVELVHVQPQAQGRTPR